MTFSQGNIPIVWRITPLTGPVRQAFPQEHSGRYVRISIRKLHHDLSGFVWADHNWARFHEFVIHKLAYLLHSYYII